MVPAGRADVGTSAEQVCEAGQKPGEEEEDDDDFDLDAPGEASCVCTHACRRTHTHAR